MESVETVNRVQVLLPPGVWLAIKLIELERGVTPDELLNGLLDRMQDDPDELRRIKALVHSLFDGLARGLSFSEALPDDALDSLAVSCWFTNECDARATEEILEMTPSELEIMEQKCRAHHCDATILYMAKLFRVPPGVISKGRVSAAKWEEAI